MPSRPALLALAALFLAVVLLVEGFYYYRRDVHGPRARISRRLKALERGEIHEEVEASLRRHAESRGDSFRARLLDHFEGKLTQAGMGISPEQLLLFVTAATFSLAVLVLAIAALAGMLRSVGAVLPILAFAAAIGTAAPMLYIGHRAAGRVRKFEAQFPVALDIFVRGLRAGHPVPSALQLLVEEMPDPIGSEFATVVAEISYGYALRDALSSLAGRVRTQDVQMFAVSVGIQAETGGNLADVLDGLSKVIRERQSLYLKVRSLASEGKMTAIVLSVLPVVTFLFVFVTQPGFYLNAAGDSWFVPGFIGIGVWYLCGMLIIRKLVDLKV